MGKKVVACAAQLGPASGSKAETVERMVSLVQEAGRAGVELLTFPELALTPYFCTNVREEYEHFFDKEMPSPETEPLFRAAKKNKIAFLLPYAEKDGDTYYNSAVMTDNDGPGPGNLSQDPHPRRRGAHGTPYARDPGEALLHAREPGLSRLPNGQGKGGRPDLLRPPLPRVLPLPGAGGRRDNLRPVQHPDLR